MRLRLRQRFSRFLGAGAVGFVIDAGVFAFCIEVLRLGPFAARIIAFIIAAVATWLINRKLAFADRAAVSRKASEFGCYALASLSAGSVNLAAYIVLLNIFGTAHLLPYLALAGGVGVGLLINFVLYNSIVFRGRSR